MSTPKARLPFTTAHRNTFSMSSPAPASLTLNGKGGEQISEITYKPDDVIVFQPKTLHGWINGDAAFDFLGFDMPVLRK
jgi:hypothetical protein